MRQIRLSGGIGAVASIMAGLLIAGSTLAAPAANAIPNPHCGDGENYDQSGCPDVDGTYIPDPGNDRSLGARHDACATVNSGETDALTIANELIARYHITASEADGYVEVPSVPPQVPTLCAPNPSVAAGWQLKRLRLQRPRPPQSLSPRAQRMTSTGPAGKHQLPPNPQPRGLVDDPFDI